ncbi:ornithine decarboxylase [Microbacterium sp. UMB0228]|uniref:aminotransferase class I/II-fold pyridoxal phosphate-dependent enzyme n=1 Tax=unclassified Microbacterium TaxID=2609290 RepID=UPI000C80A76A|nr:MULTISPECIES: ornithine decarboxylase [unclassified Microbacterium]PMC07053.1 ornithine decarboxylase [Microbacterium sp. UMB0228]
MDQNRAPILEAMNEYHELNRYGYTPPGHRQGRGVDPRVLEVLGADVFRNDLLASAGLDDRSSTNGYLSDAENLMADAVGADHAFFSTCGSSLSVKATILAVTRGEGEILIGRDAHKSVTAGLVLSGLQPRWISPTWDPELHIAHPPSPDAVEKMWQRYPDASAALITSPTPYGTCADIAAIAEVCHKRGKPLIIDEAWGAHLPFHDDLPTWAMDAGADVCVVSVHKMGMGLEQGSIYHLQGDLVDPVRLQQCADVLATTSANVLLYAAMDGWRRQMVQHGREMIGRTLELVDDARTRIDRLPGLHVLGDELVRAEASHDFDPMHILIDVSGLGISGYQAADWLRAETRLDVGLNDPTRIEATFSLADRPESADLLIAALTALGQAADGLPAAPPVHRPAPGDLELETVMRPRDAFFGPVEVVPAVEAVGRIAAEQITPYPPGVPAVLPGERIEEAVVDYLRSGAEAGMVIPDAADPSVETIRVVRS